MEWFYLGLGAYLLLILLHAVHRVLIENSVHFLVQNAREQVDDLRLRNTRLVGELFYLNEKLKKYSIPLGDEFIASYNEQYGDVMKFVACTEISETDLRDVTNIQSYTKWAQGRNLEKIVVELNKKGLFETLTHTLPDNNPRSHFKRLLTTTLLVVNPRSRQKEIIVRPILTM